MNNDPDLRVEWLKLIRALFLVVVIPVGTLAILVILFSVIGTHRQ